MQAGGRRQCSRSGLRQRALQPPGPPQDTAKAPKSAVSRSMRTRAIVLAALFVLVGFGAVVYNLYQLQIVQHDDLAARADARELYTRVKAEDSTGLWHLSGLMCAQHRSDTIADIKQALLARRQALAAGQNSAPIRVISTQLVEAGVDIDFPVVYRALAGLDSIAQAAGRCNREGRLDKGEVHVFVPPKPAPPEAI